ncbi:hypothetical protein SARC_12791 [Sphaeroforma arctica JP610]|uniref:MurL N-terminal domain-containing protein n=1 Tax=Sphaeroforma arctica JP610 TaxID=667725 RepID=A0A0L0FD52_9EUKA|nr:hypothetical protein SARC_12791 [Sphaeroforma arctica JP610]KNC74670.1 hypothetical protein SARC_12791 [Sphaeroforma arctica JP610]|eukprot:XP_014148572.1 hypothetical protein SARC_12791 [Sphaeroforma arctica JP610]
MTIAAWLLMGYDADVVVVRCGSLCAAQVAFWNDLYRGALSEFYYINDLVVPQFTIISEGPDIAPHDPPQQTKTPHKKRALVPLGGGKDSLVALERMRTSGYDCTLLYGGCTLVSY